MINRFRWFSPRLRYMPPMLLAAGVWFGFSLVSAQRSGLTPAARSARSGQTSGPTSGQTGGQKGGIRTSSPAGVSTPDSRVEAGDLDFAAALLAPETTAFSNLRTEPAPANPALQDGAVVRRMVSPAKLEVLK
jgi:hypothetical protein